MSKNIQMNSCPNPKCQEKFEDLIIVHDNSKTPAEIYYACPYCLFKLDPTTMQVLKKEETSIEEKNETKSKPPEKEIPPTMQVLKKEETSIEEKTETKSKPPEKEIPPGCPQYLGYLFVRPKDAPIPQECLICLKMLDCTLKGDHLVRRSKREEAECVEQIPQ